MLTNADVSSLKTQRPKSAWMIAIQRDIGQWERIEYGIEMAKDGIKTRIRTLIGTVTTFATRYVNALIVPCYPTEEYERGTIHNGV